jgi:hypothetical protein
VSITRRYPDGNYSSWLINWSVGKGLGKSFACGSSPRAEKQRRRHRANWNGVYDALHTIHPVTLHNEDSLLSGTVTIITFSPRSTSNTWDDQKHNVKVVSVGWVRLRDNCVSYETYETARISFTRIISTCIRHVSYERFSLRNTTLSLK